MTPSEPNVSGVETSPRNPSCSSHWRWIAVFLSILFPGAGQFITGRRWVGAKWLFGLLLLQLLLMWTLASPLFRNLVFSFVVAAGLVVTWLVMLVNSSRCIRRPRFFDWLIVMAAMIAISILLPSLWHPFLRPFRVPTGAMEPTIRGRKLLANGKRVEGDHFLAERYVYWFSEPKRGDVIVFENRGFTHALPKDFFVKRIIGVPGDELSVRQGHLFVDGKSVENPSILAKLRIEDIRAGIAAYLKENGESFRVPAGSYFVIGDNTSNSSDSRLWGPVPGDAIIGRVSKICWPWERAGTLLNPRGE